jgi:hypothetical protein
MRRPESLALALDVAAACGVHSLTTGALLNPKVRKSATVRGVLTLPLHLAPAESSGVANLCTYAGACAALCLDGAGNPAYATGKSRARVARSILWHEGRAAFLTILIAEIAAHVADARARRLAPAVRLNATSDILYERIPVHVPRDLAGYVRARHGVRIRAGEHAHIFSVFPRVAFYDYTKVPVRYRAPRLPGNYSLTYSYDPHNLAHVSDALRAGFNVAVPFQGRQLPAEYLGRPVIDGDTHDYRPADGTAPDGGPVIVGLRFKRITAPHVVARVGAHAARTGAGFAVAA